MPSCLLAGCLGSQQYSASPNPKPQYSGGLMFKGRRRRMSPLKQKKSKFTIFCSVEPSANYMLLINIGKGNIVTQSTYSNARLF